MKSGPKPLNNDHAYAITTEKGDEFVNCYGDRCEDNEERTLFAVLINQVATHFD
jgi:hypothetical protein